MCSEIHDMDHQGHATKPMHRLSSGGGYLVQKTLRGCAANMGSKISLLVYEWPLIKCKIWYMNGLIFQKFRNLSQNWLKFKKILEKSGDFVQNLAKNWTDWYMNGSLFLEKLVLVWVYTFKFRGGTSLPRPNLSTPPPGLSFKNTGLENTWELIFLMKDCNWSLLLLQTW